MSTRKRKTEQYQIAIHESGHAVMGHFAGIKIRSVTIIPDGETVGLCANYYKFRNITEEQLNPNHPRYPKHFHNAICAAMQSFAGAYSEEKYLGVKAEPHDDDFVSAMNALGLFAFGERQHRMLCEYAEARCLDMLDTPLMRKSILAVADALVERRRLTGDEVEEIVSEVLA